VSKKKRIFDLGEIMEDLKCDEFRKLKHFMNNTEQRPHSLDETLREQQLWISEFVETWDFKESVEAVQEEAASQ